MQNLFYTKAPDAVKPPYVGSDPNCPGCKGEGGYHWLGSNESGDGWAPCSCYVAPAITFAAQPLDNEVQF